MSAKNLDAALEIIFRHEGGYVWNPHDPGGETNMGISKRAYPRLDIKNLTKDQAATIYRNDYWNKVRGDDLPPGVDLSVFDMAVNAGPSRSAKILQKVIGTTKDGVIRVITLKTVTEAAYDDLAPYRYVIQDYYIARLDFYRGLSGWDRFGRGWTRRADETRDASLKLDAIQPPTADDLVDQAGLAIAGEIDGELSKINNVLEETAISKNDIRHSVIRARALLERLK